MPLTAVSTQKLYSRLLDTRGRLSPAERHTNSNCLECLAHGRACLFEASGRLEQANGAHAATIVRIRCMHDYSAEYEYTIRPILFGPNRIRVEY